MCMLFCRWNSEGELELCDRTVSVVRADQACNIKVNHIKR
ncbi:hypothetical protein SD22575_4969 [Shigella dysenteriae 225-75]|nr:hypothetical protein SD22575_4969 [Shigella dysenteriae 225-75]